MSKRYDENPISWKLVSDRTYPAVLSKCGMLLLLAQSVLQSACCGIGTPKSDKIKGIPSHPMHQLDRFQSTALKKFHNVDKIFVLVVPCTASRARDI